MKASLLHPQYGQIDYIENIWTGKKHLQINGMPLTRRSGKTFLLKQGEEEIRYYVKGNFISGIKLSIGEDTVQLSRRVKWYELVLSLFIAIFIIVWGNSAYLSTILPIMGGVIGGAIAGLMAIVNLSVIIGKEKIWQKLLLTLAMLIVAYIAAFLIYPLILIVYMIVT